VPVKLRRRMTIADISATALVFTAGVALLILTVRSLWGYR
jgi:hypothetical protein